MSDINLDNAGLALALAFAAGFATCIGAAAVYFPQVVKLASKNVLASGLGFSAGVMAYISLTDIFVKSQDGFVADDNEPAIAYTLATVSLFAGMAIMKLICALVHWLDGHNHHDVTLFDQDKLKNTPPAVPEVVDASDTRDASKNTDSATDDKDLEATLASVDVNITSDAAEGSDKGASPKIEKDENDISQEDTSDNKKLQRVGINTAIAIALHNFPEGLLCFVAVLIEPAVGAALAIGIAFHNIPEGLCVALPMYYSSGSRHVGFALAFFSGLSEPLGALLGYAIISASGEDIRNTIYGVLFGIVGGMMLIIVVQEILPTAYRFDPNDSVVTSSFIFGCMFMATSLVLFSF